MVSVLSEVFVNFSLELLTTLASAITIFIFLVAIDYSNLAISETIVEIEMIRLDSLFFNDALLFLYHKVKISYSVLNYPVKSSMIFMTKSTNF